MLLQTKISFNYLEKEKRQMQQTLKKRYGGIENGLIIM